MTRCDVTIVGAGPYGLAAGAHLAQIKGLEVRSFGEPMEFWRTYMPAGMFLRSPWSASTISDPAEALTIDQFNALQKDKVPVPIPLDTFVQYGLWFRQQALPGLETRKIRRVERDAAGFRVTSETGESWTSTRVIIAAGLGSFAQRPEVFSKLS